MCRGWRTAITFSVLALAAGPGRGLAQGTVNASAAAGGVPCTQKQYPGPTAVAFCNSGNPIAHAYSFAEFGGSSGAGGGTLQNAYSSAASGGSAGGTWNDILTWSDPAVSRVVFSFLWGDYLYVRPQDQAVAPGSGAWASSALSASIGLPGGPGAAHSSYLAGGSAPGATPGVNYTQFFGAPVFSVPVAGLTSIPLSFSWQSQAFAVGDAETSSQSWVELLTVQLYDSNGQRLVPRYQFANNLYVAEVTPEPGPLLLVASGLAALLALALRRRRRVA